MNRLVKDQHGTAAVEFALVVPLFLMLAFGIMVFGLYFGGLIAVTNAAAEGARASIGGLTTAERQNLASNAASTAFASYAPFLNPSFMAINATPDPQSASRFQVQVSYDFSHYDLAGLGSMVPLPMAKPSIAVSVQNAGSF